MRWKWPCCAPSGPEWPRRRQTHPRETLKEEQIKLTSLRKDYGDFCDETGLKRQAFRLQVARQRQREAREAYYRKPEQATIHSNLTSVTNRGNIGIQGDEQMPGIQSPIELRNTGKGKPNAMEHFGRPLNNRQQWLNDALPEYDSRITVPKKNVNLKDIAALTAKNKC